MVTIATEIPCWSFVLLVEEVFSRITFMLLKIIRNSISKVEYIKSYILIVRSDLRL